MEMHTGQPLYSGADDTDQLWLILKTCTDEQLHSIKDSAILQVRIWKDFNASAASNIDKC